MNGWRIEYADLVGDNGTPAISTGELASMARELQSLRASIPGGVGVKGLEWTVERRSGFNIHVGRGLGLKYEAAIKAYNPGWIVTCGTGVVFDGSEADEEEAKAAAQADYERRILSALDLSPAEEEIGR